MKMKGFTLIELLSVIVILAIIALIAVPIIINIIGSSKESTQKRSLELYKSAVEQAVARYNLNNTTPLSNGDYTPNNDGTLLTLNETNKFKVSYSGNVVKCNVNLNEGNVTLSNCIIDGSIVKNDVIADANQGETCKIDIGTAWNFDYSQEGEQQFSIPCSGTYKLETWGAQGGSAGSYRGGYGAYAEGKIELTENEVLYINVGGKGNSSSKSAVMSVAGGYNGGGSGYQKEKNTLRVGGGGGATHIAQTSGLLSELNNNVDDILIVAAGGAGGYGYTGNWFIGSSGGGYLGSYTNDSTAAGTQSSGFAFGQGGYSKDNYIKTSNYSGGGGGFYGGYGYWGEKGSGGGSSYIGNTLLTDKVMYCYGCTESSEANIKTIKTTTVNTTAIERTVKQNNGYARITYLGPKISNLNNYPDLITAVKNSNLKNDSIKSFKVNGEFYTAHVYNFNGNQTWSENKTFGTSTDVATATEDAKNMVIVKVNGNLTINEGVKVTTYGTEYGGPKGFFLYVTGTLTNKGTITMTARGAKAEGQNVYLYQNEDGSYEYVPSIGAVGGAAKTLTSQGTTNGNPGISGIQRQTGGGGTGSGRRYQHNATYSKGGTGTSYSGGSGGGAANTDGSSGWAVTSGAGSSLGAAGGNGVVGSKNSGGFAQVSLGGIGNPTGGYASYRSTINSYTPNNGTGGLLIIYANSLRNTGSITANGVGGGTIDVSYTGGNGGRIDAGGSSGGGSVNIFANTIKNTGPIKATGGESTTFGSGNYSGAGGDGSVSVGLISTKTYEQIVLINDYFDFDYEGKEAVFVVPTTGVYRLETWGAQGGYGICNGDICASTGGYGGYSTGYVNLTKGESLYINVGEKGPNAVYAKNVRGGYNGGGGGSWDTHDNESAGGGGGATHIAKASGLLSELENYKGEYIEANATYNSNKILIVSGGGGGFAWSHASGSGGGYLGGITNYTIQTKASQSSGYLFGQGQTGVGRGGNDSGDDGVGGGGGGFYGGLMNNVKSQSSGAGGSGYIGSSLLTNKVMYCYNCEESDATHTKTISTTNVSATPTANYAKKGNGYARITLIEETS